MVFRNFQDLSAGCANTKPAPERLEQHLRSVISRLTTPERSIAFNYSCCSGRLVETISKSYCLSLSMTLLGAVAPLVRASRAEVSSALLANLLYEVVVDSDVGQ